MNRVGFWRGEYLVCVRRRVFYLTFSSPAPSLHLQWKVLQRGRQMIWRGKVGSKLSSESVWVVQWFDNCPPAKYVFISNYLICFLFGAMEASSFGSLCTGQARCCLDFCPPRSYRLHCCMTAWSPDQVLTIWNPPIFEASRASPSCSYWILNNNAAVLDLGRLISWSKCWW